MRAVVLTATGAPEVLVGGDVPDPTPLPHEAVVQVEGAGVHFVEVQMRAGVFPIPTPMVFGTQAAGTVVAVGNEVDRAWVGTRVIASTQAGAYAEYVAAKAAALTPIPDELDTNSALAVLMQGSVAMALFEIARPSATDSVLIEAAGTGIGYYLTQLVAPTEATIVATASPGRQAQAKKAGADHVIDHTAPEWAAEIATHLEKRTLDQVFESEGGDTARELLPYVTPLTGRMYYYGMRSGLPAAITTTDLLLGGHTLVGCSGTAWRARVAQAGKTVLDLAVAGRMTPLVDITMQLDHAAEAHRRIESRENIGMVILRP